MAPVYIVKEKTERSLSWKCRMHTRHTSRTVPPSGLFGLMSVILPVFLALVAFIVAILAIKFFINYVTKYGFAASRSRGITDPYSRRYSE